MYFKMFTFLFLLFAVSSCITAEQNVCDFEVSGSNNYIIAIDQLALNFPYRVPDQLPNLESDLQQYDSSADVSVNFSPFNRTTTVKIENSMNVYTDFVMDGDASGISFPATFMFVQSCE